MSIANREPERVARHASKVEPRCPPPDEYEQMLVDFLAWLREAKGYRVCEKTGERNGESLYSRISRAPRKEAASEFVSEMGMAPYQPPEPLINPDATITGLMADSDSAVDDTTTSDEDDEELFDLF